MIASEKTFLAVYYSNREIVSDGWCIDNKILVWDNATGTGDGSKYYHIMSPKTFSDYKKFIAKMEAEMPLLAELR